MRGLSVLLLPALLGSTAAADISVDLATSGKAFPHYWKRCFGSGHALLGTRADWQSHLKLAAAELGIQGVRMHGVLDDDMSVAKCTDPDPTKGCFSFYNVDRVYDFLLSQGVTPIVELSFMPKALAKCDLEVCADSPCAKNGTCTPCQVGFSDGGSYKGAMNMPPADYEDFYNLVKAMANHMVERHGLAEVSTWHWEVWNEMWGVDYPTHYLPLFNASSRALKDVHKSLRVGGPSTMQTQHVQDLIVDTKRHGIAIDFISTHFYPSDPNCTKPGVGMNGISGDDPDCFAKVLKTAHSFAAEAGLPFLITEYKDGLQGGRPIEGHDHNPSARTGGGHHGDLSYAAAFVMHNVPLLTELDLWSYWTFTDVFEEGWGMPGPPFHGQFGCMTKEGIRKPVWRAFQALHQAGDTLLNLTVNSGIDDSDELQHKDGAATASTVTAFATTHASGSDADVRGLQVFVTNFSPMVGATATPINVTTQDITLTIKPAKGATIPPTAFLWRIDDNSTRGFAAWEEMGSPVYPTPVQLAELHTASEMKAEELTVAGGGTVAFKLPPYAVGIVRFSDATY